MNNPPPGFPHMNGIHSALKHDDIPEPHYLSGQAYISKFESVMLPYKNDLLKNFGHKIVSKDAVSNAATSAEEKKFQNSPKYTGSGEKPYQCDTCKKTFSQQSNLCKHVLIHYGVKPFGCDNCGKRFTQQANLIKHKRIHTGDKPYACKVCMRQFSQNANLKKHIQLHTGEKRYRCEFCDKAFVQQANLARHRRTHTGEKPFECNVCQKRFTQKGNLMKHEVIHYLKEGAARHPEFQNKIPEKGTIDSLLSTPENTAQSTSTENYHRRLGIPMVLSGRDGMFAKRY